MSVISSVGLDWIGFCNELTLLQKANSLADTINVQGLTEEGATNLLSQPDNSDKVDLNNYRLVEVGIAKLMIFPPVNAPVTAKPLGRRHWG
jgi:hypothetical protein